MKISVIGPRVLIRPDQMPEMTADGKLHLVYDRQRSTMSGVVVALGDGPEYFKRAYVAGYEAGSEKACGVPVEPEDPAYEHAVAVGERVLFSPDKGEELIFEKDLLVCMLEDDILAVVDSGVSE